MFVSFVLLITLATTVAAKANSCSDVAAHCNQLLTEANDIIADQDKVIKLYQQKNSVLFQNMQLAQAAYEEQKAKANAWYRQPEIIIPTSILLGFIGAYAVQGLSK